MEEKELDKVTAFDTLFTTNHIQMCKVLLSYLPISYQSTLAVYIKLAELNYTLSFLKHHPHAHLSAVSSVRAAQQTPDYSNNNDETKNFSMLIDDISPYLSYAERNRFLQIKNMMQNMKNLQEMMEMVEMMKSLFPDGIGGSEADDGTSGNNPNGSPINSDFLSVLSGMSGMDFDPSVLAQAMQMMSSGETTDEMENETKTETDND